MIFKDRPWWEVRELPGEKGGGFQVTLRSPNGKTLLMSRVYKTQREIDRLLCCIEDSVIATTRSELNTNRFPESVVDKKEILL